MSDSVVQYILGFVSGFFFFRIFFWEITRAIYRDEFMGFLTEFMTDEEIERISKRMEKANEHM